MRLMPYWMTRWAIRRMNGEGRPAVVYIHPYELDDQEIRSFKGRIPLHLYWSQGMNRHQTERKLCRLLTEFNFAPIREAIEL